MASVRCVKLEEVEALTAEGYVYVDVRSESEFEQGHPPGALNVPISLRGSGGPEPNLDFAPVMEKLFEKHRKLLIACASGGRSRRAAALLAERGFENLCDFPAGFCGSRDPFGRPVPGWSKAGLPIETGNPAGRCYADLKRHAG